MPAIPNSRREMFARLIAAGGKTQLQCYIEAGFSENSGASAASNLARDPQVVDRIQELLTLRSDRGIIPENEIDVDEIVTGDKINEEWLLRQLQSLLKKAKELGQLKVARDSLADIGSIKGIGVANNNGGEENKNDGIPSIGKIDIKIIASKIAEAGNALDQLFGEAVDITPEHVEVPVLIDGNNRPEPKSDGDAESDYDPPEELQ